MACTTDKFVINKGLTNDFTLTIKQNDSTLPMVIDPSDTFVAKLKLLSDDSVTATIDMTLQAGIGQITVLNDAGGQIVLSLDAALVNTLVKERGWKEDGYYIKPTYKLAIDCTTVNNGNFVAKVDKVYVD